MSKRKKRKRRKRRAQQVLQPLVNHKTTAVAVLMWLVPSPLTK